VFWLKITLRLMDSVDVKFCRTCNERLVPISKGQINLGEGMLGGGDHMVELGVDGGQF